MALTLQQKQDIAARLVASEQQAQAPTQPQPTEPTPGILPPEQTTAAEVLAGTGARTVDDATLRAAIKKAADLNAPPQQRAAAQAFLEEEQRKRSIRETQGIQTADPTGLEKIPTKQTAGGGFEFNVQETAEAEAERKSLVGRAEEQTETAGQLEKGGVVSKINLGLVGGSGRDLMQLLADADREGGAGGLIQKGISSAAGAIGDLPEFLGGAVIGGKFPASGSVPGKRVEFLTKLMPSLTQQPTRPEGSVRLVTTVFDKFQKTIPDRGTSLITGRRQMKETLLSFFRFARVAEKAGREFSKEFTPEEIDKIYDKNIEKLEPQLDRKMNSWAEAIQKLSDDIKLSDEEELAFDNLVNTVLEPLDIRIKEKEETRRKKAGGGELSDDDQATLEAAERRIQELLLKQAGGGQ